LGWAQVGIASIVVGTFIPGLASAAIVPAIAALAIVAAASVDSALVKAPALGAQRYYYLFTLVITLVWLALMTLWGSRIAVAVGYYRPVAILLIAVAVVAGCASFLAARNRTARVALAALVLLAGSFKLAHWGHHVPEWNYRHSQAPWGRAIGQWLPPKKAIYTFHAWPTDLAFATKRRVRQLVDPRLVIDWPEPGPKFLLLLESEFTHWLDKWPRIVEIARFQDEWGDVRVLARTVGLFTWKDEPPREMQIADSLDESVTETVRR
jgi:hypothetical protein